MAVARELLGFIWAIGQVLKCHSRRRRRLAAKGGEGIGQRTIYGKENPRKTLALSLANARHQTEAAPRRINVMRFSNPRISG